jgi:hypothetical protein
MTIRRDDSIYLEIAFEDSSTALLALDQTTLHSGDHIAHLIAGERQKAGLLPRADQIHSPLELKSGPWKKSATFA